MGQFVVQPRSSLLPFAIFKSKTYIFEINRSWKVSPISCALLLVSGLNGFVQAPVRVMERFPASAGVWPGSRGFTASLDSLDS